MESEQHSSLSPSRLTLSPDSPKNLDLSDPNAKKDNKQRDNFMKSFCYSNLDNIIFTKRGRKSSDN